MIRFLSLACCAALALAACDATTYDLDDFEGVWELKGENEYYLKIDSTRMTVYDYKGDAVDKGPACFTVSSGRLAALGSGAYMLGEGTDALVVEMRRTGSTLTVNFGAIEAQYGQNARTSFTPVCPAS